MKVQELIAAFNKERKNDVDEEQKMLWLKTLDMQAEREVILTHEGAETEAHFEDWGMESELYIKEPYQDAYLYYLDMRMAYGNNEQKRYNMASTLFNNAYLTWQDYYNRTHMPLRVHPKWFRHDLL